MKSTNREDLCSSLGYANQLIYAFIRRQLENSHKHIELLWLSWLEPNPAEDKLCDGIFSFQRRITNENQHRLRAMMPGGWVHQINALIN